MINTDQRNIFLKIKAIANSIDLALAYGDEGDKGNLDMLAMILTDLCNEYDDAEE